MKCKSIRLIVLQELSKESRTFSSITNNLSRRSAPASVKDENIAMRSAAQLYRYAVNLRSK